MSTDKDKQAKFREYVKAAVKDGLSLINEKQPKPLGYIDWPHLSFYDSGFPHLSSEFIFDGPPDYKNVFRSYGNKPEISVDEIVSFNNLLNFVRSDDFFLKRFFSPGKTIDKIKNQLDSSFLKNLVFRIPFSIIDRYIHTYNIMVFQVEKFDQLYFPLANFLFKESLSCDIVVPILFVKFDFDEFELSGNASIERIKEPYHLARKKIKDYGTGVHESVLSAATHCLILKNYTFNNRDYFSLKNLFSNPDFYPTNIINKFFASMRVITGVDTGYCQLLLRPKNWATDYEGDLPPLEGTSIDAYPSWFENYYWLKDDYPKIRHDDFEEISNFFLNLDEIKNKPIHIAIMRLNLCSLRVHDEDSVLDATIGLESLLSTDNRHEITHKLAMRAGALAKIGNFYDRTPHQVFKDIKYIYGYRSAVVHGSSKAEKKKEIILKQNTIVPTSKLALDYLRIVIRILIENPKYRKSENIDKYLLLNSDNLAN